MRLIDADVMIRDLKKLSAKQSKRYGQDDISVTMTNAIIADIEAIPTVEPQRIKGKWLKKESVDRWDDTLWGCSECGCLHSDNVFCISGDFNYCPNCGAWMLGEPYKGEQDD